jgi:hypothetical protein
LIRNKEQGTKNPDKCKNEPSIPLYCTEKRGFGF